MEKYEDRKFHCCKRSCAINLNEIDKYKFLAPTIIGQFIYVIRQELNQEVDALFVFANDNVLVNSSQTMIQI